MSYTDVLDMLDKQGGKCAYSGVIMEAEQPNSHWRMSLERLDNSQGYTSSNCLLVAAEFNSSDFSAKISKNVDPKSVTGTAQWSIRKLREVPKLQRQHVDLSQLELDIEVAKMRQSLTFSRLPRTLHSHMDSVRQCPPCSQFFPRECFSCQRLLHRGCQLQVLHKTPRKTTALLYEGTLADA